ncbi:MAG: hypothetical protein IPL61_16985 [Myxococcales bacterium]|nr:hypothetical protein [Myxococcales bacterium]
MTRTHRIALLIAGTALIAGAQAASADVRIRIGGGAHVRFGGGAPIRAHWVHRHVHQPTVRIGGSIWIGGGYYQPFAQPPPPPPPPPVSCDCEQPAYYPIAPQPVGYVAAPAPVATAPLSRFGIGAFLGGVSVDGEHEGKDVGLVGQFRLTRGLIAEAEIAKNELAGGARIDRRIMAGLQIELRPYRRFTPYLAGALGTTQVEVGDSWQDHQTMAELGGGARYRLSERLSIFGDVRFGQRQLSDQADRPLDTTTARAIIPSPDETYSRVRLGGMVTF